MKVEILDPALASAAHKLSQSLSRAGGRALLVGGGVRDILLGQPLADLDFEVYGLHADKLQSVLAKDFALDLVGRSFGVLKIKHLAIDVAIPRHESKRGSGHRGFEVHGDPFMSLPEAASRRDFTVNAMALDLLTGELHDPWNGQRDLQTKVLRHVSKKFSEDPLRVLRGMQMAARFDLEPAAETVELCRHIEPEGLAPERIFEEWRKLVLKGAKPSRGLRLLHDCGWLRYFPELEALVHCPQDPEWHPEGDAWVHTLHVMDAFAGQRLGDPWEDLVVGLGCLCHDLGKPLTTHFTDGRWRSPGHEEDGEAPTRAFLARMSEQQKLADEVVPLVREHLKPMVLWKAQAGPAAIRRLARRVGRIDRLVRVAQADHAGRPPLDTHLEAGVWLIEQAERLALEQAAPKPLILGRHLIDLGLEPGRHFGPMLEALFEAQLDGRFDNVDDGLALARDLVSADVSADVSSDVSAAASAAVPDVDPSTTS